MAICSYKIVIDEGLIMPSETIEFIKWLIANYPSLLLLLIGIFLIIFDYVKSIKAFSVDIEKQTTEPHKSDKLFKIGLALMIMGVGLSTITYIWVEYPQYITVDGRIKYWDDEPVRFALIKVENNPPVRADYNGEFTIKNVSRNAYEILYSIRGLDYIPQDLHISSLDLWTHNATIIVTKPVYVVNGRVSNENNVPLDGAVVSMGNEASTTNDGYYTIEKVSYNPKTEEFCRTNISYEGILRYSKRLRVASSEYTQDMLTRNIDLSSPRSTKVFGRLSYNDIPVGNAQVEVDGKKGITDSNGNYSIQGVSRKARLWKVIIDGNSTEGDIYSQLDIPPFIYDREVRNDINL